MVGYGMYPEKQLPTLSNVNKLGNLNISSGRLPVNWLLLSWIVVKKRCVEELKIFEREPSRTFEYRIRDFKFCKFEGIVPDKKFEKRPRY